MYISNESAILREKQAKNNRTEIISRLYAMDFNLVPASGKRACVEWTKYRSQRVAEDEIRQWMRSVFPCKVGHGKWKPSLLNFALLTGQIPWSESNPGIVVVDTDDEEAEQLVSQRCPDTPMKQMTPSGGVHRIYRRPAVDHLPNRQGTWIDGQRYKVDIRADGGYILAPGSLGESGKVYEELMPWSLELLMKCPTYDPKWLPCEGSKSTPASLSTSLPDQLAEDRHSRAIEATYLPIVKREAMARRYMESVPGTREGDGADRQCTTLTMKLMYGFALPADTVQSILTAWGRRDDQLDEKGRWYPWEAEEVARKIDWCRTQKYRGSVGDRLATTMSESSSAALTIDPKDQMATAKQFFNYCYSSDDGGTLVHQQSTWHHWTGKRYEVVSDNDIRARLWNWLSDCKVVIKGKVRGYKPTRSVVSGVMDALKAVANQSSTLKAPCWLGDGPEDVIAFDNGLLAVDRLLADNSTTLLSHSPMWFSSNCLPHRYEADAPCPQWLAFLDQVFDGDAERVCALQQWFGYNLIADNRYQKMAFLIGPPRSGKGTTLAVLSALLGKHNVASVSLASLGGRFGLEPVVDKLAAIIDEGHLGRSSDTSAILERLKAISGGSDQGVDRKGLAALSNVALKVRFTLAVNELPRLTDASAALRSRLLIIPYFNTYEGKEDVGLVDRLLGEIPGITNWALSGLKTLTTNNRFNNPKAGEAILRDFVYLSSPVQAFVDEWCDVGPERSVRRKEIQAAWSRWCDDNGHVAGSSADFGRKLRAVLPKVTDEHRRTNGDRDRWYVGITLSADASNGL